jgi:hypothetical protein
VETRAVTLFEMFGAEAGDMIDGLAQELSIPPEAFTSLEEDLAGMSNTGTPSRLPTKPKTTWSLPTFAILAGVGLAAWAVWQAYKH